MDYGFQHELRATSQAWVGSMGKIANISTENSLRKVALADTITDILS